MARKRIPEEHANHEAWAIPYADLMTLLLAFFVVMYAISTLNEGKYKVMAEAMTAAFGGPPRSIKPVQPGTTQLTGSDFDRPAPISIGPKAAGPQALAPRPDPVTRLSSMASQANIPLDHDRLRTAKEQLETIARKLDRALSPLVDRKLVVVRRADLWLEVQINSDILFPPGSATLAPMARETLEELAGVLDDAPNPVRVEGYTDDRPINTSQFPSNWELSAARAASVVHLFSRTGMLPERLAMIGYGEFRPIADNATEEGRNSNRRVLLVILATDQQSPATPSPYVVAPGAAVDGATEAVAANTGDGVAPAMNGPAATGETGTAAASTETTGGGPGTTGKIQGAQ